VDDALLKHLLALAFDFVFHKLRWRYGRTATGVVFGRWWMRWSRCRCGGRLVDWIGTSTRGTQPLNVEEHTTQTERDQAVATNHLSTHVVAMKT